MITSCQFFFRSPSRIWFYLPGLIIIFILYYSYIFLQKQLSRVESEMMKIIHELWQINPSVFLNLYYIIIIFFAKTVEPGWERDDEKNSRIKTDQSISFFKFATLTSEKKCFYKRKGDHELVMGRDISHHVSTKRHFILSLEWKLDGCCCYCCCCCCCLRVWWKWSGLLQVF